MGMREHCTMVKIFYIMLCKLIECFTSKQNFSCASYTLRNADQKPTMAWLFEMTPPNPFTEEQNLLFNF